MKTEVKKLRDISIVITKGTTPSNIGAEFTKDGIKYIRSEMITSAKYITGNYMFISPETHAKLKRSQLQKGDILFSMAGVYLGKTAILREEDVPANTNQAVALIRINRDLCDNEFAYYYLNLPQVILAVNTLQSQSAQPNINLKQIGNLNIVLPDLATQTKISKFLSSYDNLIENNQKQIKLLEESAQRLYKEWFVNFHFPGYEHIKITNNLPEGWALGTLQQIANFKRGKTITKAQVQEGNIPVVAGGLEPAYYHNVANTKAPVITVSGSGANAGFTRMYYTDVFASDCSFVDASTSDFLPFIYCFLKSNRSKLDTLQKGAAQPHVYAKDINALELYVPSHDLLQRFCDITRPLFAKIGVLEQQSIELSQARDRLLPMLMNQDIKI